MLLFTVKETFLLTGLGIVLTPGLGDKMVRVGQNIRLIRPDRSIIHTTIQGITFETKDILLGGQLTKEDIPIGTEVWLIE